MTTHYQPTNLAVDPLEVFANLAGQHENCFLLETLGDQEQPQTTGRSYIGIAPRHLYTLRDNQLYKDNTLQTGKAFELLQDVVAPQAGESSYCGGLVGFSSHEAVSYSEPSLHFHYSRLFPDAIYGQYDDGLIFAQGQPPQYFYREKNRLELYSKAHTAESSLSITYTDTQKNQSSYEQMVRQARDDIQHGRVFQVVLANKLSYTFEGDLLLLYQELRRINPSPFMFFMKVGDIVTMGASPELLSYTNTSGRTYLEALAGTIRRGATTNEDAQLAQQLLVDEKEVAEHRMLVDLARNDIGRVSNIGSVQLDQLLYIKRLSHVQHICSIVSGQLPADRTAIDAYLSVFPNGTLTGAPKIEAIKMISELEGSERGPWGGSVGYFSYSGEAMHAVNIRSVSAVGRRLFMHSGSGIVYDSQPERERTEVAEKKAAMDRAMTPFMKEKQP